ncbi:cupin domain-containing protein [Streptomyces capparidis]
MAGAAAAGAGARSGLVVPPGAGRVLANPFHRVHLKAGGEHGAWASVFEVEVPPGFDVGAHLHKGSQELFYVLEGEVELLAFEPRVRTRDSWRDWEAADGRRAVRARPGTLAFVPEGCPHAFANLSDRPARMLFQAAPAPDHERYFDELMAILERAGSDGVDHEAIAALRVRYGIEQLTPLVPAVNGAPDQH